MPVAITGMHRSGTSMVAHALSLCGLDLGPVDQLLAADDWNSDGYWENRALIELDDWALAQLGGSWDMPPAAAATDELRQEFVETARRAVAEVGFGELWGWKDPRVCLLADLWQEAVADLRFVVVVRSPIEVSLSLLRRGATSARLGLSLWSAYYSELLARVAPSDRVIVSYDAFLDDPAGSIDRLLERLGIAADEGRRDAAIGSVDARLRHHAGDAEGVAALPEHIADLYAALLAEADGGAPAEAPQAAATLSRPAAGGFDVEILAAAYSERDALLGQVKGLTADRDNWRSKASETTWRSRMENGLRNLQKKGEERDSRLSELEELTGAGNAVAAAETAREPVGAAEPADDRDWQEEAMRLENELRLLEAKGAERDRRIKELQELTRSAGKVATGVGAGAGAGDATDERDWREEARRLQLDRDAWRTEARHWRSGTERLVAAEQRRLSWRLRQARFRYARRLWRALPAAVRNQLRPLVFRTANHDFIGPEPFEKDTPSSSSPSARPPAEPRPTRPARLPEPIEVPVSVVVPTFNAGSDAALFLAALERQVGVPQLELVIADSGSTDGTREQFAAAADVLLDIPAGEFGHGRTRNQAFAASSGEVVVMMVQDALLLGPHALHDLAAELLSDDGLAAVSARQVPRSHSDLYGAHNVVTHYRALWREGRSAGSSDPLHRRAAAGVDDVCAAIRRATWEQGVQYRDVEFGEDIDFGMRALEAGWRIGLSDDVAVAHSHTRDARYQFRRSVADRLYIAPLVRENAVCRSAQAGDVAEIAAAGRDLLGDIAGTLALTGEEHEPLSVLFKRVAERVWTPITTMAPSGGELLVLAEFLDELAAGASGDAVSKPLRLEFTGLLRWPMLTEFAAAQRGASLDDISDFLAKLAATLIGRSVGDRLRVHESAPERERLLVGV